MFKMFKPGNALPLVAALTWLFLLLDMAARVLRPEAHADLRAIAITSALIAAFGRFTSAFVKTMREHTQAMTKHVLAIDRFWEMSSRAGAHAQIDALKATGTGPFKIVRS